LKGLSAIWSRGRACSAFGNVGQRGLLAPHDGGGQRVLPYRISREHAVDHQVLLRQADGGQFFMGARRLAQRGALRAGHQHQARALHVGQGGHGLLVLAALLLQPGQRPQAGGVALACLQKTAPCARQLQQADGVARGRGVEQDVLVAGA
jgi:hypothetical protein